MIIASSPDESIFAWTSHEIESSGLLAPWPDCFKDSGNVVLRLDKSSPAAPRVYEMTNQGLKFPAPFVYHYSTKNKAISLTLHCWKMQQGNWRAVVLFLNNVGGYWKRVRCSEFGEAKEVKMFTRGRFLRGVPPVQEICIPQRSIMK